MSTDLLDRFEERIGNSKKARQRLQRLDRDVQYLLAHLDDWRSEHPNRWVAVYNGELVAVEDSKERLIKAIARKGLPLPEVLVDFVSEEEVSLIL